VPRRAAGSIGGPIALRGLAPPGLNPQPVEPKSQVGSYICGIIISLFLLWLSFYLYSDQETSMIGFIAGTILSIASGVVFIMGGFWFIIIPLPFVYIRKVGCNKPYQPSKRKIILGILSIIFPVLTILALYALRSINILLTEYLF
jgi:high-affinity Fe2+/Pb2+ permease